jgi:quercetin dioxygenase-like cupin family protein
MTDVQQVLPRFTFSVNGATSQIYHANKGEGLPKHTHEYSHITACVAGSIAVRKETYNGTLDGTKQPINLRGSEWHELEALEDGTIFINQFAVVDNSNVKSIPV